MSKILAIFGATGQQGGSVMRHVLNDPELSKTYKIRAITRHVQSEQAKRLPAEVQVVQGDVHDRASVDAALTGAHTVFAITNPSFGPDGFDVEYSSGCRIADVAAEKGVEYIIFSTLPSIRDISGGKYTKVTPFDVKAKIEQHIRGLDIKSAFFAPASFMENFQSYPFMAPRPSADGTWVMARHNSPDSRMALIDAVGDSGKFVGAILAEPDKYQGKTLCSAVGFYTMEEIVAAMSRATGKLIVYKQIPLDEFRESLPPSMADVFVELFSYYEEFGYFGPDSERLVAWGAGNARGKLSTLEEYLEAHPLQLAEH